MLTEYDMIRDDGAKCRCDNRQIAEFEALGWRKAGKPTEAEAESAPAASAMDEGELGPLVDKRAVPHLHAMGIYDAAGLAKLSLADAIAVPWIGVKRAAETLRKAAEKAGL